MDSILVPSFFLALFVTFFLGFIVALFDKNRTILECLRDKHYWKQNLIIGCTSVFTCTVTMTLLTYFKL